MKKVATVVCFSVLLSACNMNAGSGSLVNRSSTSLTAEERALRSKQETFNRTVVEGAVSGAVFGALMGGMFGNDRNDILAGAAVGGALGAASGYYIAGRQSAFATKEQQLNEAIQVTRQQNAQLDQTLSLQRQVIASDRAKITRLRQQVSSGEASASDLRAAVSSARANQAAMNDISGDLRGEASKLSQNVSIARSTSASGARLLQGEVNQFNSKRGTFDRELSQYDSFIDSIDLGEV